MTPELLIQLKNSGFPFREDVWVKDWIHPDDYPTLSELIEACAGKNLKLEEKSDHRPEYRFYAICDGQGFWHDGSTPEIAVAKLYLALHAK